MGNKYVLNIESKLNSLRVDIDADTDVRALVSAFKKSQLLRKHANGCWKRFTLMADSGRVIPGLQQMLSDADHEGKA